MMADPKCRQRALKNIMFGQQDQIAPADTSRFTDQLPAHATAETWPDCGHMIIWDTMKRARSHASTPMTVAKAFDRRRIDSDWLRLPRQLGQTPLRR